MSSLFCLRSFNDRIESYNSDKFFLKQRTLLNCTRSTRFSFNHGKPILRMAFFLNADGLSLQVRSRSLTQLDSLSGSMLDTGEHHLEGDPSQQQPHQLHHHQQAHQLQHNPLGIECNRIRFLAPNATPAEIANSNRRPKLSRSQVSVFIDKCLTSASSRCITLQIIRDVTVPRLFFNGIISRFLLGSLASFN